MTILQMVRRFASPSCADCLYRLGIVHCVVNSCPACRMTGQRPSFSCPSFPYRRLSENRPRQSGDGAERCKKHEESKK